jgi:hypothetical protein
MTRASLAKDLEIFPVINYKDNLVFAFGSAALRGVVPARPAVDASPWPDSIYRVA